MWADAEAPALYPRINRREPVEPAIEREFNRNSIGRSFQGSRCETGAVAQL